MTLLISFSLQPDLHFLYIFLQPDGFSATFPALNSRQRSLKLTNVDLANVTTEVRLFMVTHTGVHFQFVTGKVLSQAFCVLCKKHCCKIF